MVALIIHKLNLNWKEHEYYKVRIADREDCYQYTKLFLSTVTIETMDLRLAKKHPEKHKEKMEKRNIKGLTVQRPPYSFTSYKTRH